LEHQTCAADPLAAGSDTNDIMVIFEEIDRASGSFGGGQPASPVPGV
jgi:hypothetical protein